MTVAWGIRARLGFYQSTANHRLGATLWGTSGWGESILMGTGTSVPTLLVVRGWNRSGLKLPLSGAGGGFLTKHTHIDLLSFIGQGH